MRLRLLTLVILLVFQTGTSAQSIVGDWLLLSSNGLGDEISFLPDHRIEFHSPSGVRRVEFFRTMIDRGFFPFWEIAEQMPSLNQPIDIIFRYQSQTIMRMKGLYRFTTKDRMKLYFAPGNKSIRPPTIPLQDSLGILLVLKKNPKINKK